MAKQTTEVVGKTYVGIEVLNTAKADDSIQRNELGLLKKADLVKAFGEMKIDGSLATFGNILVVGNKNSDDFMIIQKVDKSTEGKVVKITYLRG